MSVAFIIIRKGLRKSAWSPRAFTCLSPPFLSPRLTHNLDGVVIELLFRRARSVKSWATRITMPAGSVYLHIPQLTGRSSAQALPSLPLAFSWPGKGQNGRDL